MIATPEVLIAQRVLVRDMPDRSRVVATLRISQLGGNAHPHFSTTANVYEPHGTWSGAAQQRSGREPDGGGRVHDEILRAFPGAAPFVAMHLSDYPSGTPMHAAANAWYFYSDGHLAYELKHYGPEYVERHGTGRERAASILRCAVDDLPFSDEADAPITRTEFVAFVDNQRERWAREAAAAFELLQTMPDCTDLRGYDTSGQAIDQQPLPGWLIGSSESEFVDV